MNNPEKALSNFEKGMNCAQSVLATFGPSFGLDEKICIRIASPFGGGIGHIQEICGAVSGAIMAIGLKHGAGTDQRDKRDRINGLAQEFIRAFKKKNNSILCRDLLGFDISTQSGLIEARNRGIFKVCPGYVRSAAEILDLML